MADPTNLGVLEDLKFITRYDIFPVLAGEYTLRGLIDKTFGATDDAQMASLMDTINELEAERQRRRRSRRGDGRGNLGRRRCRRRWKTRRSSS